MSGEENAGDDAGAWRATTDRERIRALAEAHGAVPVRVRRPDGETVVRLERRPDGEQIPWSAFHEAFDPDRHAVRYRVGADAGEGSPGELRVVAGDPVEPESDREVRAADADGPVAGDAGRRAEEPPDADAEQVATSDTGDAEPVVYDREGTERTGPADSGAASTAPTGDAEKAPGGPASGLVLDEIRENPVGSDRRNLDAEYVVLRNEGGAAIDLSGWTVENEAGRTYRVPDGFVLDPGDRVTLHSGAGEDADDHLYWDAGEPVWDNRGDTVLVRTDAGERVVREPYEA